MRYLWFSAFAICGIALYLWIETWAQAHREAHQRLLDELNREMACSLHGNTDCWICKPLGVHSYQHDSITPADYGSSTVNQTN